MVRRVAFCCAAVVFVVSCKSSSKHEELPSAPIQTGHSRTKIKADKPPPADAAAADAPAPNPAPADAAPAGDAGAAGDIGPRIGGNGSPPYRDPSGQVRGPGGPVFMGHGPPCDLTNDHCLRPDVWFSVQNIVSGKLYRALPVFQFESNWYDWRGREVSPVKLYRTKAAGNSPIRSGTDVILFSTDTGTRSMWVDSEHESLTSSRWVAGVTETASKGNMVRIKGWNDVPVATVRLIVGTKAP